MYKLRDYQQEAVNNAVKYFQKKRDPVMIVLPTGAGKSLVIAELARIANGRVLVLAHVKELVEQNYEKYKSYGQSAGIFSASLGKKDREQKAIFGSVQSLLAPLMIFLMTSPCLSSTNATELLKKGRLSTKRS